MDRKEHVYALIKHSEDGDEFDFFGQKVRIIHFEIYDNETPGIGSFRFVLNDGNTLYFLLTNWGD